MKIAYLDCFSGISGDMFLGALLDLGLSFEDLSKVLGSMPIEGFHLKMNRETRNEITGTRFAVELDKREQPTRGLNAIREIIKQGCMASSVKEKSIKIFEELAGVEAKIHNRSREEIHFHEIGAVDSIIDIVGSIYGIEFLGIQSFFVSPLPLGSGFTDTAHGRIPIPVPATIVMLKGFPVFDSGVHHEMVTPTGAALVKGLSCTAGPMPPMTVLEAGYGVGKRHLPDRPNLLRVLIGDFQSDRESETVIILETNIDDASPEWLGFLMERLFESGALDVVFFPVQMKKNRPGVQIQVIGRPDHKDLLMDVLFRESATLGIRFRYCQRMILKRTTKKVDSPWGKINVKKVINSDGSDYFLPEYEECRRIAIKNNLPLREIFCRVLGLNNS